MKLTEVIRRAKEIRKVYSNEELTEVEVSEEEIRMTAWEVAIFLASDESFIIEKENYETYSWQSGQHRIEIKIDFASDCGYVNLNGESRKFNISDLNTSNNLYYCLIGYQKVAIRDTKLSEKIKKYHESLLKTLPLSIDFNDFQASFNYDLYCSKRYDRDKLREQKLNNMKLEDKIKRFGAVEISEDKFNSGRRVYKIEKNIKSVIEFLDAYEIDESYKVEKTNMSDRAARNLCYALENND